MPRSGFPRLLGDVGGTHARFAWQEAAGAALTNVVVERCSNHASLAAAVKHYLATHRRPQPRACAIGIATPVVGDDVRMTNGNWSFSIAALRRSIDLPELLVINDFVALALALPVLDAASVRQVGPGRADPMSVRAVLGPGTGLGVSCLLPDFEAGRALMGEGGHVTLAASDEHEADVITTLRERFGHVSAERALSGPGLVNLYHAVATLKQCATDEAMTPPEVIERCLARSDPSAVEAVALFCSFLGNVAGNLALTLGARGGVYIGGGIVPRLGHAFDDARFRERFEAKGRFQAYLADVPTFVIASELSPALLGAARALDLADAR